MWALVGDIRNWTKWLKDISDVETSHTFTSVATQLNRSPNGGGGVPQRWEVGDEPIRLDLEDLLGARKPAQLMAAQAAQPDIIVG